MKWAYSAMRSTLIIELFSSVDSTMRLLQTDDFSDFVRTFARGIA